MNTGGCGQEGKGSPGVPSVSCGVQHRISRGHREAKPKEPGSECPDVNPLQVVSHKHGSWHHWLKKPKVREALCDPWAVPTHLSKAARCLDWGQEPPLPQQVCKQGQRDVLLEIQRSTAGDLGFQMWLGQWRLRFRWVGMD